ncbi:nipalike protein 2 [Fusarium sporotrichioides]|uniref:Nipalike protein 2 n=1 Tax=Fusarium sporotrichioides TaxID=5514 RepID=A0A395RKM7_FUSSP|nr:nipalike protein 2 [Fusarium sporotrichioides]
MRHADVEPPWPSMVIDPWAQNNSSDSSHHGDSRKPGDKIQEWSSLIGIITAIVGNVLIALALNVQRYAHIRLHKQRNRNRRRAKEALKHNQNGDHGGSYGTIGGDSDGARYHNGHGAGASTDEQNHVNGSRETDPLTGSFHSEASGSSGSKQDEDETSSSYLKSPYWWLGQVLITLGEMGNFLAYGFAPASIVSPLGVVALISNCIIAPAMFHEKFRHRDFWGVVIAVGGVVTVVLSAKQEETKLNPHDVWDAITTLAFEIYLAVTIFLILCLMWASPRYGKRTILIDLGLVGLFGGYTALATKGVSSMLSSTLWRAFATPVTYVLIAILLGTAIMQIRYVNRALQRFDSTQVIPIQFVMFTLCVIIGSAVLYRDFERTNTEQAAKFVGGCLLTFFGVFLITSGREQSHDDDEVLSEAADFEDTIGLADQDGNGASNYQDVQGFSTPKSQSRRSSHLSNYNHSDAHRALVAAVTPQHENNVPSAKAMSSQRSPGQETLASGFPWNDYGEPSTPPGRGVRAYSTDSVMAAPGATSAGAFASHPTTPMREPMASDGSLLPRALASPTKPSGSGNRSRTFISPSPLSSTVTAVVKDAFLRASDDPRVRQSSMRRIRSTIRAGLFFNEDGENADAENTTQSNILSTSSAVPASVENLPSTVEEDEGSTAEGDQTRRRSRSVSDTLGDFFGVRRKKRYDSYFAGDVEDGTLGGATPSRDHVDLQRGHREV